MTIRITKYKFPHLIRSHWIRNIVFLYSAGGILYTWLIIVTCARILLFSLPLGLPYGGYWCSHQSWQNSWSFQQSIPCTPSSKSSLIHVTVLKMVHSAEGNLSPLKEGRMCYNETINIKRHLHWLRKRTNWMQK